MTTPVLCVSMCPGPCLVSRESERWEAEREELEGPSPTYGHQRSTEEEEPEPRATLCPRTRRLGFSFGCYHSHSIPRPVSPSAAQHSPSTERTVNDTSTEMNYGNLTG